jgi:hypothetical protein
LLRAARVGKLSKFLLVENLFVESGINLVGLRLVVE